MLRLGLPEDGRQGHRRSQRIGPQTLAEAGSQTLAEAGSQTLAEAGPQTLAEAGPQTLAEAGPQTLAEIEEISEIGRLFYLTIPQVETHFTSFDSDCLKTSVSGLTLLVYDRCL